MPFSCALCLFVSQAVLLQSLGYYSEMSGCGMQVVYIAARGINLVPELITLIQKRSIFLLLKYGICGKRS
jgi:hypothetical protein